MQSQSRRLGRRGFLALGAAAVASPLVAAGSRPASPALPGGRLIERRFVAAERPFSIIGPGRPPLPLWTYADEPLPVIRLAHGDRLRATLENRLPEHTAIHWHGLRIPNAVDGVPYVTQPPVRPGERFTYDLTPPDTGTFFFHSHCNTAEQLGRGLAGVLIVEGDAGQPFDADLVCAVRDWRLGPDGAFLPFLTEEGAGRAGTFGTVRTVNGLERPVLPVPAGGDVRLRVLSLDPTRVMEIGIEGAEAAVIATDGNALPPVPLRSWRLGSGMRLDLALRAPPPGGEARLVDYFAPEPVTLAVLRGEGPGLARGAFAPAPLRASPIPAPDLATAERIRLTFSATAVAQELVLPNGEVLRYADSLCLAPQTFWAINQRSWPERGHEALPPPLLDLRLGGSYRLELVNATPHQHPIHLHGFTFTMLKGKRLPEHRADTVLLGPKDRVEIAFQADRPGDWMLHCHTIEHQETGMMGYVRVA